MVECERCHKKFGSYAALKQHYGGRHPNAKWSDAFEARLAEENNLRAYAANLRPGRGSNRTLLIGVVLVLVVVGAGIYVPSIFQTSASPSCAAFPFPPIVGQDLVAHYHAILMI